MVSVWRTKQGKSWKIALLQNGLGKQHKQCVSRFGQLLGGPHAHLHLFSVTDQQIPLCGQMLSLLAAVLTCWVENYCIRVTLQAAVQDTETLKYYSQKVQIQ